MLKISSLFEAYITNLGKYNEGRLVGETLKFPATTEKMQALLKRIGVDGVRYAEMPGVGCEHLTPENSVDYRAFRGRFMGGAYDFIAPPGFAEILLTFWKGGRMDKNQSYEIIQAVMLENGRGFALGHDPAAPSPYVTWACYDDDKG